MDLNRLPNEINTDILKRLPIKPLIRCKLISKTFRSFIQNADFVNTHFSFSIPQINNSSSFLLLRYGDKLHPAQLFIAEDTDEHEAPPPPLPSSSSPIVRLSKINQPFPYSSEDKSSPLHLVGACNGLVCVSEWDLSWYAQSVVPDFSVHICNPATGDYVRVPDLILPNSTTHVVVASGFGFDPVANEFKVIYIFTFKDALKQDLMEINVYTLGLASSWRKVYGSVPSSTCISGSSQAFVNGNHHWITLSFNQLVAQDDETGGGGGKLASLPCIVSFDIVNETFGVVPCPAFSFRSDPQHNYTDMSLQGFSLGMLGGCLCLSDDCYSLLGGCFEIWVMKDYNVRESWTKQFVISKQFMGRAHGKYINEISPVCFRMNGDLVLQCEHDFIISYNIESGKGTLLEDDELPKFDKKYKSCFYKHNPVKKLCKVVPYVGNLISPSYLAQQEINLEV